MHKTSLRSFAIVVLLVLFNSASCNKKESAQNTLTRVNAVDQLPAHFRGYEGPLPTGVYEQPRMLPAFELPSERTLPGKEDASSDYREAHKEWFAITIPTDEVSGTIVGMIEWEPMQALLLTLSGNSLAGQVDQGLADMTYGSVHTAGVDVYLLYTSESHKDSLIDRLEDKGITEDEMDMVHFVDMDHGSIWMIDYGPFPIKNAAGDIAFVDFRYYNSRHVDDGAPTRMGHEIFGIDTFRMPIDFEGGNLQMDSMGTCYSSTGLTTRNSEFSFEALEALMGQYLGCTKLVILNPLKDEGTSHIDMFFKLVNDNTVILGSYTSEQDPENKILMDENQETIEALVLPDGSTVSVHRMPMPSNQNHSVWRTYINSTFVKGPNGGVNLWPTYSIEPNLEAQALEIWQELMPDWEHQKVLSDTIISWGGAMHCISRTVPVGNNVRWVQPGSCDGDSCDPVNAATGYDGLCGVSTGCAGPKWLCDYNNCIPPEPDNCNGITYQGCCADGNLVFCEDNEIQNWDCAGEGCGWSEQGNYYLCDREGDGPAEFPIDCPAECTPSCDGAQCGDDGCGGSCGSCGPNEACTSGQCVSDVDCGEVPQTGCCDGDTLFWCENNGLKSKGCDSSGQCGWDEQNGIYNCHFSGDGPVEFPKECVGTCVPACDGLSCGDDGCGGTCGTCAGGESCTMGACIPDDGSCGSIDAKGQCAGDTLLACTPQGNLLMTECEECCGWIESAGYNDCLTGSACQSCTPSCDQRQCGPDGCGGICGICDSNQQCSSGVCTGAAPAPDATGSNDQGTNPELGAGSGSSGGCAASPDSTNKNRPWSILWMTTLGLWLFSRQKRHPTLP